MLLRCPLRKLPPKPVPTLYQHVLDHLLAQNADFDQRFITIWDDDVPSGEYLRLIAQTHLNMFVSVADNALHGSEDDVNSKKDVKSPPKRVKWAGMKRVYVTSQRNLHYDRSTEPDRQISDPPPTQKSCDLDKVRVQNYHFESPTGAGDRKPSFVFVYPRAEDDAMAWLGHVRAILRVASQTIVQYHPPCHRWHECIDNNYSPDSQQAIRLAFGFGFKVMLLDKRVQAFHRHLGGLQGGSIRLLLDLQEAQRHLTKTLRKLGGHKAMRTKKHASLMQSVENARDALKDAAEQAGDKGLTTLRDMLRAIIISMVDIIGSNSATTQVGNGPSYLAQRHMTVILGYLLPSVERIADQVEEDAEAVYSNMDLALQGINFDLAIHDNEVANMTATCLHAEEVTAEMMERYVGWLSTADTLRNAYRCIETLGRS